MQSSIVLNTINKNCLGVDNMGAYVSALISFLQKKLNQTIPPQNLIQLLVCFPTDFKVSE